MSLTCTSEAGSLAWRSDMIFSDAALAGHHDVSGDDRMLFNLM